MSKEVFTYGLLDEKLRALGFITRTQKGKARIYRHEKTGARIILPDASFEEEVLPHHVAVARHVLAEYNLGEMDREQATQNSTPNTSWK